MLDYHKIGMAYTEQLANNPVYKAYEDACLYWVDRAFAESVKMYFFPFFVMGNIDSWKDMLTCQIKPKK